LALTGFRLSLGIGSGQALCLMAGLFAIDARLSNWIGKTYRLPVPFCLSGSGLVIGSVRVLTGFRLSLGIGSGQALCLMAGLFAIDARLSNWIG
jgi:hypothetical protein